MSCDSNPEYLDFWPVAAKACLKLGMQPVLFYITTNEHAAPAAVAGGQVHTFEPIPDIPVRIQASMLRYWGCVYYPDDVVMVNDIDLIPLSKKFFIDRLQDIRNDAYVHVPPRARVREKARYGTITSTEILKNYPIEQATYLNAIYHIARGDIMREVLGFSDSWPESCRKTVSHWYQINQHHQELPLEKKIHNMKFDRDSVFGDEIYPSIMAAMAEKRGRRITLLPYFSEEFTWIERRIRGNFDKEKLCTGYYSALHASRPYSKYKAVIDDFLDLHDRLNISAFADKPQVTFVHSHPSPPFPLSPLDRLLRKPHPELTGGHMRNWEKIDQHCRRVLEAVRHPSPKSLVRLGDGELDILRQVDKRSGQKNFKEFAYEIANAAKHADCLGLTNCFRADDHNTARWRADTIKVLREEYGVEINCVRFGANLFMYAPGLIGQLAQNKRVLWITSGADKVVNNLNHAAFRDYYGLHDIVDNDWINTQPAGYRAYPEGQWQEAVKNIRQQLLKTSDFDLAMIGVGGVGKLVCHHIKTDFGKTAIDIGAMMSAMQNKNVRTVWREGRWLHPLWDPIFYSDKTA